MKKSVDRRNLKNTVRSIILVTVGTLILSFGTSLFLMEFDLVAGGVSGIAIVLDRIVSDFVPQLRFVTINMIIAILTWTLFFIGHFVLGKGFALKTLLSSAIYPLGIAFFSRLADPDILGGFFYLKGYETHSEIALILASVLGGACVGAGCSITFIGGGSTGGIDIIAFTVCKIFKRAKSSTVLFIIDAAIVISGMFVIQNLIISLLGMISAFVSALTVDKIFIGSNRSFIAQIISCKHEAINREILDRIGRGTTIVEVKGGYTGESKKMITVSFTVNQYAELLSTVSRHDKKAFVTILRAHEINGEGFTEQSN